MQDHIAISVGTLERWKRNLRKAIDSGLIPENCGAEDKVEAVEQQISIQISISEPIPNEQVPGHTKKDLVEALDLGNNIDYALPQGWVDDVRKKTSLEAAPHFVWDCGSNWGPIAITETGKLILAVYKHITE